MSGYEERECRSCYGCGYVLLDAQYDYTSGELVQEETPCLICKGEGRVSVYLYAKPSLRRAAVESVVWLAWNGNAKERRLAEKELRRQEGRNL